MRLYFILILSIFSCGDNHKAKALKQDTINIVSSNNSSGLKYNELGVAVKSKNIHSVESLLNKGADIENAAEDEYNQYGALYIAIKENDMKMVDFLIKHKANINVILNDEGATLLSSAIKLENYSIAKILILNGANTLASLDVEGNKKFIPILEATIANQKDLVKLLIDYGANPNEENNEGISAHVYAKDKNLKILSLFENEKSIGLSKGTYKIECSSKNALIILDDNNAYLDLITNDGYVRLTTTIKKESDKYLILFDNISGITRLNKSLNWKEISTEKPIITIKNSTSKTLTIIWNGFFNNKTNKIEKIKNSFEDINNNEFVIKNCE